MSGVIAVKPNLLDRFLLLGLVYACLFGPFFRQPNLPAWLVVNVVLTMLLGIITNIRFNPAYRLVACLQQMVIIAYSTAHGAGAFMPLPSWHAWIAAQLFLILPWRAGMAASAGILILFFLSLVNAAVFISPVQATKLLGEAAFQMVVVATGFWHWRTRLDEQESVRKSSEAATSLAQANVRLQESAIQARKLAIMEERNRFARDIHDTVGHALTSIILQANAAIELWTVSTDLAVKRLEMIRDTAREGMEQIRHSVRDLTAPTVERPRGKALWHSVTEAFAEATGVDVSLVLAEDFHDVPEEINEVIFRLIQEGLTNAVRHGHAARVEVDIRSDDEYLLIRISDDGQGVSRVKPGHGLKGMRERVRALDGEVDWMSKPGMGFALGVDIPWKRGASKSSGYAS